MEANWAKVPPPTIKFPISITTAAVALMCGLNGFSDVRALYETSFEELKQGALTGQKDGDCGWSSEDPASITSKFEATGTQCLHLAGGKDNTLETFLIGDRQNSWA